ncbi:MAG: purine-nucleoside phosphorylase [Proteobacteria bacterium]|nr:purine-nucleoside phosphorylase [Desulfobulbaceae bacterium]MBU4152538.1 purine-nucleoside phosphorylase [Pseudomonadota bacterium]
MTVHKERYSLVRIAADFLTSRITKQPDLAVVLGSGQNLLPDGFVTEGVIDYSEIPDFPQTTAPGHRGSLIHGYLADKYCLIFQGRFHWYEGYDTKTITLPIRIMAELQIPAMIITNTAGGLNLSFAAGNLMVITDHINLISDNPLRGINREEWGPRFPDLSRAYSPRLWDIAHDAASALGISLRSGVYIGIPGPSLETPAETRMLRMWGGDAVGMSTVSEVIAAVHAGIEVLGLSIIANVNNPDQMQPIMMDEVLAQVTKAADTARRLLAEIIKKI